MKLDFALPIDGQVHEYCLDYHHEAIEHHRDDGNRKHYYCHTCQKDYDRRIKIGPGIIWWVAADREYWHESVGVFVRNPDNKFLFYTRTISPFVLTIPSGHVDAGEEAQAAAPRELKEEVDLEGDLLSICTEDILGDQCSQGADAHRWHVYLLKVDPTPPVHVTIYEGKDPVWLTLDEALEKELTAPVRYLIERYGKLLTTR